MQKILRLITSLALAFTWQVATASTSGTTTKIDSIAAIIDAQPILESDITTRFQIIKDRIPGGRYSDDVRRQILTQMIDESLQANFAIRRGLRTNPTEVDRAIMNVAANIGTDLTGLQQMLSQQGIDYTRYRAQVENEILLSNVKQQVIKDRIAITEQEIDDYLNSPQSLAQSKDEVRLRHILLRSEQASLTKTRIETIAAQINNEQDFIDKAIQYSDGQFAVQGGDLGWRPLNQLPALFVRELTNNHGPLFGPIQSNAGFHLLWLMDKRVPASQRQRQTKARHILVRPNAIRDLQQTQSLANELYQRLNNGHDFAALAREFSEDEGSALKGGDLDWVTPGTMVPEFEKQMNDVDIGQYSRPFQSPFGWHIVQIDGRRDADVSDKVKRSNAEQALIAQKQDIVLSNWLDELKAQAFIDIK